MPAPHAFRRLALLCTFVALLCVSSTAHAQDAADDLGDDPALTETWGDGGWDDPADDWDPEDDWSDDDPRWQPAVPEAPPLVKTPTVAGKVAMLRTNGKAAIPRSAPARVKAIIAAANRIVGKPYKWGGGHARLEDRGYDCSGTVGYALIHARLLSTPMVSGSFARWGVAGAGRWATIYANRGHVYMEVAGLRLDTSTGGDPRGGKGPRWRPVIGKRRGYKVRHIAGL